MQTSQSNQTPPPNKFGWQGRVLSQSKMQDGSAFEQIEERDSVLQASMKSHSSIIPHQTSLNEGTGFHSTDSLKQMLNLSSMAAQQPSSKVFALKNNKLGKDQDNIVNRSLTPIQQALNKQEGLWQTVKPSQAKFAQVVEKGQNMSTSLVDRRRQNSARQYLIKQSRSNNRLHMSMSLQNSNVVKKHGKEPLNSNENISSQKSEPSLAGKHQ